MRDDAGQAAGTSCSPSVGSSMVLLRLRVADVDRPAFAAHASGDEDGGGVAAASAAMQRTRAPSTGSAMRAR